MRTRRTYDPAEERALEPLTNAEMNALLAPLEGQDLAALATGTFAPGDWLQNGPRLLVSDGTSSVVFPTLEGLEYRLDLAALLDLDNALRNGVTETAERLPGEFIVSDIPGGRAIEVDYWTTPISAGPQRCSVASVNANWLTTDRTATYGLAVFDGEKVDGTYDDHDRGIFGERRGAGGDIEEFSWNFTGRASLNVVSNLAWLDGARLQLHSNFWSPELWGDQTQGWDWAVGGITLMTDGQVTADMTHSYTFDTKKHPFVAFKAPSTIIFGATIDMTAYELVQYLQGEGYS
ncbi:MAG: hypothetical protein KJN71_06520, partial [Acidimicrobiia bacterium]|nr:hypothetical protein [Acidimicrobiia bacterium]